MLGRTYDNQVCSISRTLEVFGERWTFLVMRNALFADSTRFVEFRQSLGIASNILSDRLSRLVDADVLARVDDGGGERYRLTPRGRDLTTALVALTEWGDRWAAPAGEPVRYVHGPDAHGVRAGLLCDTCGELDAEVIVEALPGPAMPDDLAQRLRARYLVRHGG